MPATLFLFSTASYVFLIFALINQTVTTFINSNIINMTRGEP